MYSAISLLGEGSAYIYNGDVQNGHCGLATIS